MYKRYFFLGIGLIFCIIIVSCGKNSLTNKVHKTISPESSSSNEFDVIYQGFILVNSNQVEDYAMTNYYVITNENDWITWNSKYTKDFPYYLDDFDWDNDCLVTYAYYGAKDCWNTISSIEDVSIKDNTVNIKFDDDKAKTYVFNSKDTKHIALYVIRISKPANLSSLILR